MGQVLSEHNNRLRKLEHREIMVGRKEKELRERENALKLDRDLLVVTSIPQRKRHYSP